MTWTTKWVEYKINPKGEMLFTRSIGKLLKCRIIANAEHTRNEIYINHLLVGTASRFEDAKKRMPQLLRKYTIGLPDGDEKDRYREALKAEGIWNNGRIM